MADYLFSAVFLTITVFLPSVTSTSGCRYAPETSTVFALDIKRNSMAQKNYVRETLSIRDDRKVNEETIHRVKYVTNNYIRVADAVMNAPCFHNRFSLGV